MDTGNDCTQRWTTARRVGSTCTQVQAHVLSAHPYLAAAQDVSTSTEEPTPQVPAKVLRDSAAVATAYSQWLLRLGERG